ncbi:unnamed protein product [Effrenium voratum]|nr:unnamed protein product [Effrenium voratum]
MTSTTSSTTTTVFRGRCANVCKIIMNSWKGVCDWKICKGCERCNIEEPEPEPAMEPCSSVCDSYRKNANKGNEFGFLCVKESKKGNRCYTPLSWGQARCLPTHSRCQLEETTTSESPEVAEGNKGKGKGKGKSGRSLRGAA